MAKKGKADKKHLTPNMEDYLETIHVMTKEGAPVRIKGISDRMGVKKPSANNAVQVLTSKGLVKHEKYGHVTLTVNGERLSQKIKNKHDMLVRFLTEILGVDAVTAAADACKIEHVISADTAEKLRDFMGAMDKLTGDSEPIRLEGIRPYHFLCKKGNKTALKKMKKGKNAGKKA